MIVLRKTFAPCRTYSEVIGFVLFAIQTLLFPGLLPRYLWPSVEFSARMIITCGSCEYLSALLEVILTSGFFELILERLREACGGGLLPDRHGGLEVAKDSTRKRFDGASKAKHCRV